MEKTTAKGQTLLPRTYLGYERIERTSASSYNEQLSERPVILGIVQIRLHPCNKASGGELAAIHAVLESQLQNLLELSGNLLHELAIPRHYVSLHLLQAGRVREHDLEEPWELMPAVQEHKRSALLDERPVRCIALVGPVEPVQDHDRNGACFAGLVNAKRLRVVALRAQSEDAGQQHLLVRRRRHVPVLLGQLLAPLLYHMQETLHRLEATRLELLHEFSPGRRREAAQKVEHVLPLAHEFHVSGRDALKLFTWPKREVDRRFKR
mmetsp:Transcript_12539/g.40020  ORF Transcript_12539/g.40020 Transcript_12539/m.40020 type:complete len:266 (-) Transcript_12539:1137-1934(-)